MTVARKGAAMLGRNAYERSYVEGCRAEVDRQVQAFRRMPASDAVAAFEPTFFNDLVLVLEMAFVHRLRTLEGKDGNPLNEVRLLAASLLENGGGAASPPQTHPGA